MVLYHEQNGAELLVARDQESGAAHDCREQTAQIGEEVGEVDLGPHCFFRELPLLQEQFKIFIATNFDRSDLSLLIFI